MARQAGIARKSYKITNWSKYNESLVQRGSITFWFDEQTLARWEHDNAEVKLRGVVIGEVRDIEAAGDGARLTLAIEPGRLGQIPADVTAQMLPTTLFGERFVALVPPAVPSARTLRRCRRTRRRHPG